MLVQQSEQVHHHWQRNAFAAFVAREGVVAAAGQARRRNLAQAAFRTATHVED